jgi:hypothetical protein
MKEQRQEKSTDQDDINKAVEILNKTLREHIENAITDIDNKMMSHYNDTKENSLEFNRGCVYAFALCKGSLEACLRLEDRKNEIYGWF